MPLIPVGSGSSGVCWDDFFVGGESTFVDEATSLLVDTVDESVLVLEDAAFMLL